MVSFHPVYLTRLVVVVVVVVLCRTTTAVAAALLVVVQRACDMCCALRMPDICHICGI